MRPEIAALLMAGSSLLVALNALLLKKAKLPAISRVRPEMKAKDDRHVHAGHGM